MEKNQEPKYIIKSVEFGDIDFLECMKEVIRLKLSEHINDDAEIKKDS